MTQTQLLSGLEVSGREEDPILFLRRSCKDWQVTPRDGLDGLDLEGLFEHGKCASVRGLVAERMSITGWISGKALTALECEKGMTVAEKRGPTTLRQAPPPNPARPLLTKLTRDAPDGPDPGLFHTVLNHHI